MPRIHHQDPVTLLEAVLPLQQMVAGRALQDGFPTRAVGSPADNHPQGPPVVEGKPLCLHQSEPIEQFVLTGVW